MSKSVLPFLIFVVLIPALSATAVELGREQIATGFTSPVFMTAPPGDTTRLFVVEQGGVIKIITLSNNNVLGTPFLDISAKVDSSDNEEGLLGLAFHPDYDNNGYFYLNYVNSESGRETRIARYQANTPYATSNTANAGIAEVILLSFDQPESNHNAGMLAFAPNNGYLYIATGDGGGGGDNHGIIGNGQALNTFLGKILRIDVDGTGEGNYSIPPTNPILGGGFNEIWAYGLRNPYRFGFDRDTGDLYIGDVGQGDDLFEGGGLGVLVTASDQEGQGGEDHVAGAGDVIDVPGFGGDEAGGFGGIIFGIGALVEVGAGFVEGDDEVLELVGLG